MAISETKLCQSCKQRLPRASFHKRVTSSDGLYSYCRACNVRKCKEYTESRPDWKEAKRKYDRERTQRLRDKLRVQNRQRYERKRDIILAQSKAYQAAHPEQVKATKQSYKHRRRAAERAGMTGSELLDWKRAQPKVCHWCGVKCARGYVVDHIHPLAKGGKHEAHNLAISCRACNARKSARDPIEWAQMIGKLL